MPAHPPVRRRDGGAQGGRARQNLTEAEIVEAALRLIKQSGVEGLTMRRLSKELGRSHMAMYYWVSDKAALLDLVASAALRDIPIPEAGEPGVGDSGCAS